jgi:hypothetical protein
MSLGEMSKANVAPAGFARPQPLGTVDELSRPDKSGRYQIL